MRVLSFMVLAKNCFTLYEHNYIALTVFIKCFSFATQMFFFPLKDNFKKKIYVPLIETDKFVI